MKSLFLCFAIPFIAACSSMPSKNHLLIKKNESTAYASTIAAMKIDESVSVTTQKVPISFSASSPIVKASNSLATFHKISLEKNSSTSKYLVFSAKNHVIGYLKNGYVVPEIEFFSKNGKKLQSILVQFGENAACNIGRCLITTFDISHFPEGSITGIVMAKSDSGDKPFLSKNESLSQLAGGVPINQNFNIDFYTDFFGDAEIYVSNDKPLNPETGGHSIFYQK